MQFRKLYLKVRVFLYSIRNLLNKILIAIIITTLSYLFINFFIFDTVIMNLASTYGASNQCKNAMGYYNFAYFYYGLMHYSKENKEIYFEIPYEKAMCYLNNNDKKQSVDSMVVGLNAIQNQYGVYSRENAYFGRKYLFQYYLDNNNYSLAAKEFENLMAIYRVIGYHSGDTADMIRIRGDLYYHLKQYDVAMELYRKAYNILSQESTIDYQVFAKIVERMATYQIQNKSEDLAINIYNNAINILKNSGEKQTKLTAEMLISVGDLYVKKDNTKSAIKAYEEAIALIKTLPKRNDMRQNLKTYLTELKSLYEKNNQYAEAQEIDAILLRERRFSFL